MATPVEHRESAALQEKPTDATVASAADELSTATARPPKRRRRDDENPKHDKLSFRVSPELKREIERRAAAEHLSVAHYLALKVLTNDDGAGLGGRDASLDAAVDELSRLRRQYAGATNNLNQLGRDYNSGIDLLPAAVRDAANAVHDAFEAGRLVIVEIDRVAMGLAKVKRR